jgi:hypothetical protein
MSTKTLDTGNHLRLTLRPLDNPPMLIHPHHKETTT